MISSMMQAHQSSAGTGTLMQFFCWLLDRPHDSCCPPKYQPTPTYMQQETEPTIQPPLIDSSIRHVLLPWVAVWLPVPASGELATQENRFN